MKTAPKDKNTSDLFNPYEPLDEKLEVDRPSFTDLRLTNTTGWIKLYFVIIGYQSSFFYYVILATMHYFKERYTNYFFSFYSLAAVKIPVILTLVFISLLRRVSFSYQILISLIGFLLCFIGSHYTSRHYPNTDKGLSLTLAY